jgi:CPA1 family monovalent cation:H+ antiporter
MGAEYTLVAMLLALALVGLLARVVSTPYPILLVAAGMAMAIVPGLNPPPLDPNLILLFLLPVLLYNEAFHASWHDFSRWLRPIVMLAVGLVAATIAAVAVAAKLLLPDLPWPAAFILGAIVSPTDTVAANAVLHRLRIPRRLSAILSGESLVNDATGLVALQLAIGVVLSGAFHWVEVGLSFSWMVVGGVSVGLLVGLLAKLANHMIKDTTILFTLSLVAPYAAFTLAHVMHASGVLAVVTAGFYVAWHIHTVPADTRYELDAVWRLMAYIVDALCFMLIGTEIPRMMDGAPAERLTDLLVAGGLITLTVIAIRFAWIYPTALLPLWAVPRWRKREGGYPASSSLLLASWCGMRGAVSLAAALSVPLTANGVAFPGRDAIIFCTFCVILGTLIAQGLTLQPLIRWLGIRDDVNEREEERLARVSMIEAALSRLDQIKAQPGADPAAVDHVERTYLEHLRMMVTSNRAAPHMQPPLDGPANIFSVELAAMRAERDRLLSLRNKADINDRTHDRLQEELDLAEMRARTREKLSQTG